MPNTGLRAIEIMTNWQIMTFRTRGLGLPHAGEYEQQSHSRHQSMAK